MWLLRGLHEILLSNSVRGSNYSPGGFRTHQNWIGPPGVLLDGASYVPPPPEKIPELMENWLDYWRDNSPPPIIQAAILHAQFEIVHPFMDGNGRIGRLLIPLFCLKKRHWQIPCFIYRSAFSHGEMNTNIICNNTTFILRWWRYYRTMVKKVRAAADSAVSKNLLHRNTVSRIKSRLNRLLPTAKSA
ncbi:MAG: Fic family protein [Gammaproteobacteria bacterium WSBS_2016_MAG_OTU1]